MTSTDADACKSHFKTVFLFGAGASYGAGGVRPSAPPMMSGLYDALAVFSPTSWGALPDSVKSQLQSDFEDAMGQIWRDPACSVWVPALMRAMALFFLGYGIEDFRQNAYVRLVAALKQSGRLGTTLLSTLNYDCLVEIAVSHADASVSYFDPILDEGDVLVWKLHGSCNFIPDGTGPRRATLSG